ncbi:MAG: ferritin-like domain-containing protein [Gammaproteobacteria bacterium]|nr:ferritin-like domain-containing protein [Gammaproteobacteria bacterium]
MPANRGDHRILGYLGRALSMELSAVQLYSTQARLVATWGLDEPAKRFREESQEEMQHAERIIGRMLALGVAPGASQLRPVRIGDDLASLLEHDHAFELELVQLYHDAAQHSARVGSHDDRLFFEALLDEEQAHAQELTRWMRELQQLEGDAVGRRFGLRQGTATDGSRQRRR